LTVENNDAAKDAAAIAIQSVVKEYGLSSAHITFLTEDDALRVEQLGFLHRTDQQFHFFNKGYRDYADFLDTLSSRKRKTLRKEREAALSNGISIARLTGADLTEEIWDQFYAFYMDTGSRKWGQPYLNRKFFSLIGETMSNDIVLVMAKRNGRYVAGAINFVGGERIFGRNWGCIEDHPFLHFEVCYHQAIDHAIEHGLKVVEAGAQGEHKLARGYQPVTTHSAHYIAHDRLKRAVADYLRHERLEIERVNALLGEHTPFRKGPLLTERETMEE
jgi:predicted N-acyltransferase